MKLRSRIRFSGVRRRLTGAGLASCALALSLLAGSATPARAGVSEYPATLYLSKLASTGVTSSYQLVAAAGPGLPAAPTATPIVGGTLPNSTYQYVITQVNATGGETAPSVCAPVGGSCQSNGGVQASISVAAATKKTVQLTGLPTGVTVRVYRRTSGRFQLLKELVNNASATWNDDGSTALTATILPESENRIAGSIAPSPTGFSPFAPGAPVDTSTDSTLTGTAPTTPPVAGKGWIVDGAGNVDFGSGQWELVARVRNYGGASPGPPAPAGELRLGAWAVTTNGAGGIQSSRLLVDPNASADELAPTENLSPTSAGVTTVDYKTTFPAFSLTTGEHLYLELYRYQTVGYASASGGETRVATLYAYDGVGRLVRAASISTLPNVPALVGPAAGATTSGLPTFSATFDDPDAGDTGKVEFRICAASDCSAAGDPVASGFSGSGLAIGATGSWTPGTTLATGSYFWQARNVDALAGSSAWSAARALTVDATPPETTITSAGPADPTNATDASFDFDSSEAGSTFECKLDLGSYGACSSPALYSSLADGVHTFRVRAIDAVGNVDATPASYSWTVDTVAPDTFVDSGPSDPTNVNSADLAFSSPDATAAFECRLDGAAFGPCSSPVSYSGLADGPHAFEVRATDAAGNVDLSPASWSWVVDTVAPTRPLDFDGTVDGSGLTLHWAAPASGLPASYVLYVNGVATTTLLGTTTETSVGPFGTSDTRSFAVSAVDDVGNEGPRTRALVGVPALAGLSLAETKASLVARGLRLGAVRRVLTSTPSGRILRQAPAAPGVTPVGRRVRLGVSERRIEVKSAYHLACAVGGVLRTRIKLASPRSHLSAAFYAYGERLDLVRSLGWRKRGTHTYSLRVSYLLARPARYSVRWRAVTPGGTAVSSTIWIKIRPLRPGETNPPACRPV